MLRQLLVSAVAFLFLTAIAFGGQVNTYPGWNGSDEISSFGYPDTSTYGEAITTPAGAGSVTSFSFWLQEAPGFEFQAFLSPWDNNNYQLTGSMLYMSPVLTAADGNLDEYTVSLNAPVTAGTIYMFGVTIDNVYGYDSNYGNGKMGGDILANGNSTYYFAWSNDSGDMSQLYSNWNNTGCADNGGYCGQAAFLVNYGGAPSGIPEPASLMLLGSGMLLLATFARRRARR